jgi:photosystem II stability/assembly factor-like uncharacterized protein
MGLKTTLAVLAVALGVAAPGAQPPARAAVSAGHSGWEWADPVPQGHSIRAVELEGSLGYAAGDFGTLLRTDDAGTTWTGLTTGLTVDLNHLAIIDENSVVVAGRCSVRRSDDSGVTFVRLAWTARDERCASPIAGLAFPSELRGYLVLDDGNVYQTSDGGLTWLRTTDLPSTTDVSAKATGIAFTSAESGVVTTSTGSVYRTADGGTSWTLAHQAPHGLLSVSFLGTLVGFAAGEGSIVLVTLDGGKTWAERGGESPLTLTSIHCSGLLVCLATTDTGDRLLRTADGGKTFDPIPSTGNVFAVALGTGARAIAGGRLGETMVSDDGGTTWSRVGVSLAGSYVRLRAASATLAYAAGRSGRVARTTDGGRVWQSLDVSSSEDITDVSFASRDLGFALDLPGRVLRTRDGGKSWRVVKTGTVRPQAVLARRGLVLLVGPHGVLRSSNNGASFVRVRSRAARRAKLFEVDPAGTAIVAYGSRRIAISTNSGRTWKRVNRPRRALIAAVDFATPRVGFLLEQDGRLWKTRNRGRTWHDLAGIGSDSGVGLAFSSAAKGYLVLSRFGDDPSGYLLRTTDSGRTWRPQLVTSAPLDADGVAARGATDFALSTDGSLFFTTSGGDTGGPSSVKLSTPRKRLRGRRTIRVSGRAGGAAAGSKVLVSRRFRGESGWDHQLATVGAGGVFKTTWKITTTTTYVAQWIGDSAHAGDGSAPLTVKILR